MRERERERERITWLRMKEYHRNVPMMKYQKTRFPVTI